MTENIKMFPMIVGIFETIFFDFWDMLHTKVNMLVLMPTVILSPHAAFWLKHPGAV